MVLEKTIRFVDRNIELDQLAREIEQQVQADGYKTQAVKAPIGHVIQARKEGLRDIFAANRAFTIVVFGQPNDFTVRIGIAKWVQNLAVTGIGALLTSGVLLLVDVPEQLWTIHVEGEVARKITELIDQRRPGAGAREAVSMTTGVAGGMAPSGEGTAQQPTT